MSNELYFIVMPAVIYCSQLWVNFNKGTYLKAKVLYNNIHVYRRIWGYHRWNGTSSMFVNNAIDMFDVLMCKNIYGLKKRNLSLNNGLIVVDKVMYNCIDIVNGPIVD